jgi:flagellar P-ring protein precursor FlgI
MRSALLCSVPLLALALTVLPAPTQAQVPLRDLITLDQDVPWRLVGYGLVVGLDGSGDRTVSGFSGGYTVQSVANLLRRFNIEVPTEVLRTRNVAAVLVTAEVSPYLRPGGRFELQVASLGDASSLRGGVLWTTPLTTGSMDAPVATAQGAIIISDGADGPAGFPVETSGRLPSGGLLEMPLPVTEFANTDRLLLKNPDLTTALRVAAAVNAALGDGAAIVQDPGSIQLVFPDPTQAAVALGQIAELTVIPDRPARLVIDGRDGTVVAGGGLTVGAAMVSHRGITLSIDAADTQPQDPATQQPGMVNVDPGASVQQVAQALHQVGASPSAIATIFTALREIGAVTAEVIVR